MYSQRSQGQWRYVGSGIYGGNDSNNSMNTRQENTYIYIYTWYYSGIKSRQGITVEDAPVYRKLVSCGTSRPRCAAFHSTGILSGPTPWLSGWWWWRPIAIMSGSAVAASAVRVSVPVQPRGALRYTGAGNETQKWFENRKHLRTILGRSPFPLGPLAIYPLILFRRHTPHILSTQFDIITSQSF